MDANCSELSGNWGFCMQPGDSGLCTLRPMSILPRNVHGVEHDGDVFVGVDEDAFVDVHMLECECASPFTSRSDLMDFNGYGCFSVRPVEQVVWAVASLGMLRLLYYSVVSARHQIHLKFVTTTASEKVNVWRGDQRGTDEGTDKHVRNRGSSSLSSMISLPGRSLRTFRGASPRLRNLVNDIPFILLCGSSIGYVCLLVACLLKTFTQQLIGIDLLVTMMFGVGWSFTFLATIPLNNNTFAMLCTGIMSSHNVHDVARMVWMYKIGNIFVTLFFSFGSVILLLMVYMTNLNQTRYYMVDESLDIVAYWGTPYTLPSRTALIGYTLLLSFTGGLFCAEFVGVMRITRRLINAAQVTVVDGSKASQMLESLRKFQLVYKINAAKMAVIMVGGLIFCVPVFAPYTTFMLVVGPLALADLKNNVLNFYIPKTNGDDPTSATGTRTSRQDRFFSSFRNDNSILGPVIEEEQSEEEDPTKVYEL